ncbi:bifunctional phosphopantothenoylcysteine decarboxylase/phosphopantothenate--cysteine ligase CoaBC [Faecalitalea cylindroides]|uniref:bifunctional phosphopantothenoylcysteine decarboxylase/phosphopantothenate--cysteine ligase CoaBC n=1 Tax=Faecalitalea cylindroides TaxID=39483 RepID=UPI001897FDCD|nr:bifunctional phosphopantothenoylcysteine decarboxylase/phosphopantothenate--cysteine ligase CoaBC [Faecalitalea cylindroides]MDB7947050.1 bifunctional phosphopantothenoylcysteine decarboxylase/phosphopantothenate--cysteine ligase CoaBC [Faecalitalea cylindroides]MDB7948886.1 bifunctional phosphopantothenoylcysteine decarboxylase/phosphopantothenate--cysteine ligase CoaBC [Faecalitalea cylindroides]MDB7950886.1 bifunctional phosphopantothenoylcysteine decarboxylase/phosphopantothenate--cystein
MSKKRIVVGVSGGIAAYKACDLVSKLSKKDYEVKVILTKHAEKFVSKLTFEALCHNYVETDLFDESNEDPIAHITLAKWADLMIIVPATANIIAKVTHGISDDLLSTTFLACNKHKMICPAMNTQMYENPITQKNIQACKDLGYQILDPVVGHLACNDTGRGKMIEPADIVEAIDNYFNTSNKLSEKTVLISAGPTQEAMDPVRFISNHSSGKQGYAIAKVAKAMGANVILVSGPVQLEKIEGIQTIDVTSALDMFEAIKQNADKADYIIMAAAVSDYRPENIAEHKIKKSDDTIEMTFVKNPDILAYLGQCKTKKQIICGFAMETQDLDKNAKEKLEKKNCDMLIANNLFVSGAGFQTDTNIVSLLTKDSIEHLPKLSKEELGQKILETMMKIEEGKTKC